MAVDGIDGRRRGKRKGPLVSTRFSFTVEKKRADAGRDGRTRLARPSSQARTGTGKKTMFPVQLTTSTSGNHTRLIHTLRKVLTMHILCSSLLLLYRIERCALSDLVADESVPYFALPTLFDPRGYPCGSSSTRSRILWA